MPFPKTTSPLLESKFRPQVGARTPVLRPRLAFPVDLCAGGARAVMVAAPAGYGKSTLMAGWFESLGGRECAAGGAAWLNLDENDNVPSRLLQYLIAALQRAVSELRDDTTLNFKGPVTTRAVLESLSVKLAGVSKPIVLFVDDAHLLVDAQAIEVFDWLVRYVSDKLRFVIGCRQTPRIGFAELRLRGQLIEVDQSALAFTAGEAADFCRRRLRDQLDEKTLSALLEKTEGWAAILELLTLALNDAPDAAQLIMDFSATERGVVDYLGEVVFGRLDLSQRVQIHRLAQFDRFCAHLAAVACGPEVTGDLIGNLWRRRLFLIPLDRHGQWFRFHHLVRDYLRLHVPPGVAPSATETLLAGSQWFQAHGMLEDALDCAVRAQAWGLACQWLAAAAEDLIQRMGTSANLSRWMSLIPDHEIDRYPQIRVSYIFSLAFIQEREQVEKELKHLAALIDDRDREGGRDPQSIDALRSAAGMLRMMWQGLCDEGRDLLVQAEDWLARWPNAQERHIGDALNVAAFACKSHGEIERGLEYAARSRRIHLVDGSFFGISWTFMLSALLLLKRGDYRAAQRVSQDGVSYVAEKLNRHPEHIAYHQAMLACIYYEFDDTAHAAGVLESEPTVVDATGIADFLILTYLTRARLEFRLGRYDAGLEALRLGRKLALRRDLSRVAVTLAGEECIWLSRLGDQTAALELARLFGFDRSIFPEYDVVADKAARVGPRLLLTRAPEMAVAQLGPPLARSAQKGFHHRRVELLILQAMALLRSGREDEALGSWRTALDLGERYGYRRVFLDDAEIVDTLWNAARGRMDLSQPGWLRAEPGIQGEGEDEALTRKELRILKHLESGHSNREIAESLFISEGTLKWHLHNIYRKYGCKNRTGAIAAARQRGQL